jgi:hypothetical protein
MAEDSPFRHWLSCRPSRVARARYWHLLLHERTARSDILEELRSFVRRAHDDARRHMRQVAGTPLDPLGADDPDPAAGYPERLHPITLQGYFGEVFAGLVAQEFSPFDEDGWEVPAFLFRFHEVAFQQLERMRQTGEEATPIPGRTGDDCLAFRRGPEGELVGHLVCEAKCTTDHDSSLIADAHKQVSSPEPRPVDLLRVIEVLRDAEDCESQQWAECLRKLYLSPETSTSERSDLVVYLCGRSPVRGTRQTWIDTAKPHARYSGGRRLQAGEIHLSDITDLIRLVYQVED